MTNNFENLVRPNILAFIPYSSTADESTDRKSILLNANENPFGTYNRYPDPLQRKLKEKLAALKNVLPEQIFLDNGSDNIIDSAMRIFCRPGIDKALTFTPSFGMYEVVAQINDVGLLQAILDKDFQPDMDEVENHLKNDYLKLIFICSPNNPTGNLINEKHIKFILENFKGIVILDEAYIDFCPDRSFVKYLNDYPRLIILQTLSKGWGLAGLRIGMALMSNHLTGYFNKLKMPYNISSLNQQKALKELENKRDYEHRIHLILSEKIKVEKKLANLRIVQKIYPSNANFLLVKFTNTESVYQHLLDHSLIVRNRSHQIENCLRITIGSPEENEKLIAALNMISND